MILTNLPVVGSTRVTIEDFPSSLAQVTLKNLNLSLDWWPEIHLDILVCIGSTLQRLWDGRAESAPVGRVYPIRSVFVKPGCNFYVFKDYQDPDLSDVGERWLSFVFLYSYFCIIIIFPGNKLAGAKLIQISDLFLMTDLSAPIPAVVIGSRWLVFQRMLGR